MGSREISSPPIQADYSSSPSSPQISGTENEFLLVQTQHLAPPDFAVTAGPPRPVLPHLIAPDHDIHSFLTTVQPIPAKKFQEHKVREPGGWDHVVAGYVLEQIASTTPEQPARINRCAEELSYYLSLCSYNWVIN